MEHSKLIDQAERRANRRKAEAHEKFAMPFPRSGLHTESRAVDDRVKPVPRGYYLLHCNHNRLLVLPCGSCGRTERLAQQNLPHFASGEWQKMRAKF